MLFANTGYYPGYSPLLKSGECRGTIKERWMVFGAELAAFAVFKGRN